MRTSLATARRRASAWPRRSVPPQGRSALSRPILRLWPPATTKPTTLTTGGAAGRCASPVLSLLVGGGEDRAPAALELDVRVDDTLDGGDVGEDGDDPQHRDHLVEDRAGDDQHDALRPLHETDRAAGDQALRPRARVGGHEAPES